jgi:hypothetical protein
MCVYARVAYHGDLPCQAVKPMNNDAQLLTEFQARNMGRIHYLNQFMLANGRTQPLGVVRNDFGDVTRAWYLDGVTRIFLNLSKLIHVETLRATLQGGACNVWSFPHVIPRFSIRLSYKNALWLEEPFYALSEPKAVAKARFRMSRLHSVPIQNINAWFRDNPSCIHSTRIDQSS